ncbi:cytochrome P450 [Nocardioides humi]|uniref:Cytochrome P450 n=1 Tax=Nocardioides humi TaxID=449461 RepID=A0ABN2BV57_9ACTN|nr:cytochrome P450 [Nocardioides humi]
MSVKKLVEREYSFSNLAGVTVLRGYDDIAFVLKSSLVRPLKGDIPPEGIPFVKGAIVTTHGEEHLKRRRLYSSLFSNDALHYLYHHCSRPIVTQALTRLYETHRDESGPIVADMAQFAPRMLYRTTAVVAGIDLGETDEDVDTFSSVLEQYGPGISIEFYTDVEETIKKATEAKRRLIEDYMRPALARRRALVEAFRAGRIDRAELTRDVMTLWLLDDEFAERDEDTLFIEMGEFLYAGSRTTVRVLPHIINHVAEWTADHPEDADKTTDSDFLRGAISEALRFHALVPALLREATEDFELPSGEKVSKGEWLGLVYTDANRDAERFGEDADDFDPHRIERLGRGVSPWAFAFGGGAHMCIGRRLVTGGDWRRGSQASDRDIDGTVVAIVRALFEAGVRPAAGGGQHHFNAEAVLSDFDEYLSYPVEFTTLAEFVERHKSLSAG